MTGKGIYKVLAGLFGASLVLAVPAVAGARTVAHPTTASAPRAAAKKHHVAFSASYRGTATLVIVNNGSSGSATIHNAKGTGAASVIHAGSFKQLGAAKAPSFGQQGAKYCSAFSGEALLTGTKGTLTVKVLAGSEVCSNTDSGVATAQVEKGRVELVKGTRALKGAKGTLAFTGKLVTNKAETSGSFSLVLKGTVTL